MAHLRRLIFILAAVIAAMAAPVQAAGNSKVLRVFDADSLHGYVSDLATVFGATHPGIEIRPEGSGSLDAIRKVSDLHRRCDVLIAADWRLLTAPHRGLGGWAILFAGNSMGLLYTVNSKDAAAIDANNWYRVLLRPGVRYGHSNPARDPAGYWTLILWQLAGKYYHRPGLAARLAAQCPRANIRPHNIDLISLLESGDLDYYFGYSSDARLGPLKFLALPPEMNLGDLALRKDYSMASVEVGTGAERRKITGAPIAYGVTIPDDAPNRSGAIEFIKLMVSLGGRKLAAKNGLIQRRVALGDDPANRMPAELRALVIPISGNQPPASRAGAASPITRGAP
ncbi:MAG: extracellular solute-binding protein [Candidatus Binataceae bacterium]